jgi:hypothetical protein
MRNMQCSASLVLSHARHMGSQEGWGCPPPSKKGVRVVDCYSPWLQVRLTLIALGLLGA